MPKTADEKLMKGYLRKLVRKHRELNRLIDTSKSAGKAGELGALKRLRLRIKDKIVAIERHYSGRARTA